MFWLPLTEKKKINILDIFLNVFLERTVYNHNFQKIQYFSCCVHAKQDKDIGMWLIQPNLMRKRNYLCFGGELNQINCSSK